MLGSRGMDEWPVTDKDIDMVARVVRERPFLSCWKYGRDTAWPGSDESLVGVRKLSKGNTDVRTIMRLLH